MLKQEIKELFLQCYELGNQMKAEDIGDDTELFGPKSPYGLDSMDVLKFIGLLREKYDFDITTIHPDMFRTVNKAAEFLEGQPK